MSCVIRKVLLNFFGNKIDFINFLNNDFGPDLPIDVKPDSSFDVGHLLQFTLKPFQAFKVIIFLNFLLAVLTKDKLLIDQGEILVEETVKKLESDEVKLLGSYLHGKISVFLLLIFDEAPE